MSFRTVVYRIEGNLYRPNVCTRGGSEVQTRPKETWYNSLLISSFTSGPPILNLITTRRPCSIPPLPHSTTITTTVGLTPSKGILPILLVTTAYSPTTPNSDVPSKKGSTPYERPDISPLVFSCFSLGGSTGARLHPTRSTIRVELSLRENSTLRPLDHPDDLLRLTTIVPSSFTLSLGLPLPPKPSLKHLVITHSPIYGLAPQDRLL